jgi:anti-sigma regulatory factor (Ser/Thr protein kinase)
LEYRAAHHGYRSGNTNYLLYSLFDDNYRNYSRDAGDFHDSTGFRPTTNQNGYYFETPGYDQATGIGIPNMGTLITGYRGYY